MAIERRQIRFGCVVALCCGLLSAAMLRPTDAADGRPNVAAVGQPTATADRPSAPPLPPSAGPVDAPGVAVTFSPAGREDDPAAADTRAARIIALYVPAGAGPSPFVASPKFVAAYDGAIVLRLRDTYTFSAVGRGKLTVTVNGKPALSIEGDDLSAAPAAPGVRLNKGKNAVRVRYEPPADGGATFRLLWTAKGETFAEPIPPTALVHDAAAPAVAAGERLRAGRQLLADLRCARCHTAPELSDVVPLPARGGAAAAPPAGTAAATSRLTVMLELAADAPDLSAAGQRLNRDWLAAWINDPRALRPTAHMPRVFAPPGDDPAATDPRAADVAAYVATLVDGKRTPPPPAADVAAVARGGQLFTHLNCVVCHEPPGGSVGAAGAAVGEPGKGKADEEGANTPAAPIGDAPSGGNTAGAGGASTPSGASPPARVPLKYVKAKFKPGALAAFLLNPSAHYAWVRMPNFRFTTDEAAAVAAFLLAEANGALPASPPAGDPVRGKALVESSGCLNCHVAGPAKSTLKAPALAQIGKDAWGRGCMTADAPSADDASSPAKPPALADTAGG
ncbi:MAG: Trehalose utilization, partial [Phycisphaerales bacterium]|nr:Trehalose utilization [Phycisphaerales bacterium]